jgi:hypothetical protein
MPLPIIYLLVLLAQGPLWMIGGILWGAWMIAVAGFRPLDALFGGLGWGAFMWIFAGNIFAIGLTWRRSLTVAMPDREAFKEAMERAGTKAKLTILTETPDEMVLGPRRALIRFPIQETRVQFENGKAIVTAPALSFWAVKKALSRELAVGSAGDN